MKYLVLLGRIFFALIFIASTPKQFSADNINYAAGNGVPLPNIAVPLAGIVSLLGGLSILLGFRARIGAWLLILFLVPVNFYMHKFWTITDKMAQQDQMAHFMQNVALIGACLMISYFGSGPCSLDRVIGSKKSATVSA